MASPATKPSTPRPSRLSEVARHLCLPEGIEITGFPAVRDRCAQFGITFDPWQDALGRAALGKRADGSYAASVGSVVVSIPRQTGKTYLFGWLVFALCTLIPNLTVVWTAHRTRTSDETFAKMRSMAMRKKVAPYILRRPRSSNGQQAIEFKNGSRILFGAREQGFGRGFDMVDILVLDEATSALDPISTGKIEELCLKLKNDYTIVMVTHNMQQALRISDETAFFLLGEMVECNSTDAIFSNPQDKRTEEYITGRFG